MPSVSLWFVNTGLHGPAQPGPVSTSHVPPVWWNRTAAALGTPGADTLPPEAATMTSRPSFSVMSIRTLVASPGKACACADGTSAGTDDRSGALRPAAAAGDAEPSRAAGTAKASKSTKATSRTAPGQLPSVRDAAARRW